MGSIPTAGIGLRTNSGRALAERTSKHARHSIGLVSAISLALIELRIVSPELVGVGLELSIREECLWREQPKLLSSK